MTDTQAERARTGGSDVILSDGTTARLRPIDPGDSPEIVAFHAGLSRQTVYMRYFSAHPTLSDDEVARLTRRGDPDHFALVAERAGRIVAVAQYDRDEGSEEAEVAFVVADEFQNRGLGTLLLEGLAAEGRRQGIRRFVADTLAGNHQMVGVFADVGFARRFGLDRDVIRVVMDIAPTLEAQEAADDRDRHAVVRSMERLLRPRSVAVIGASRQPGAIGFELVRNLVRGGFAGPVYPVNPAADHVASIPCWPTIGSVPAPVDMAVVAVPAGAVVETVEQCGQAGVGALVVVSAGFAEAGREGAAAQRDLVARAHDLGMRIVGPNCFGVVNTDPEVSMNASFAAETPLPGRIGFASQSGGLGIAILAEARSRMLGLSTFVSMGNKADISGNDLLAWWEQDGITEVMLLYLESFGNPRRFSRLARRIGRTTPLVVVKSGRSGAGRRAASSHTAALASSDQAVDALFHETGSIRVDTIEEMFDVSEVLVHQPLPAGMRVGILTNSGGPGVLAADACAGQGMRVAELSPATQEALALVHPGPAGVTNPVDLGAQAAPSTYEDCCRILLASREIDALVVIFTPPLLAGTEDVARAVVRGTEAVPHDCTVVMSLLGTEAGRPILRGARRPIPSFTYPETAVRALAHAAHHGEWRRRPHGVLPHLDGVDPNEARRRIAGSASADGWITGAAAMEVLGAYGIGVQPTTTATTAEEASKAAAALGFPVALKAVGPQIVHKSDVGGVRLDLADPGAVASAFAEMRSRIGPAMHAAAVQPMALPGVELLVGFTQDTMFGPQVVFSLGGTAVELLGDHVVRLAPLTDQDAHEMIHGLRGSPLLTGYRGAPGADLDALADLLLRVGRMAEDLPEVAEMDANPLIARPDGAVVVDARLRVTPSPS